MDVLHDLIPGLGTRTRVRFAGLGLELESGCAGLGLDLTRDRR